MSQKRTQIRSLTLVNFRGVFFKTLELHRLMSNLIGHNGAGKTTIMGGLLINRIPDNRLIRLRNNSDSAQDRGDSGVWGRIAQGTCYSLVDYQLYDGRRVIAGVQLRRLSQPRVELKLFAITGIDLDVPVRDLVMQPLGDNRYEPIEGKALRSKVTLMGGELERFDTTARYMDWQFNQRIIPKRMENSQDRQRYYRMLETSLYGGLSSELQKGLRDYLLPVDDKVKTSISSMQTALQETRKTRNKIEDSRQHRQMVKSVLESSYSLGEHVLAWSKHHYQHLKTELDDKQREEKRTRNNLEIAKQQLSTIQTRLDSFGINKSELEFREEDAQTQLEYAHDLNRLHRDKTRLEDEACNNRLRLEELNEHQRLMSAQCDEQVTDLKRLEEDVAMLVQQLSSVEQAYSEEARKAGLYQAAIRSLESAKESMNNVDLASDQIADTLNTVRQERQDKSLKYHQKKPLLEQAELIQAHFDKTLPLLSHLDGQAVTPVNAKTRADYWLQFRRDQHLLAQSIPTLQQALKQQQDESRQRQTFHQAITTLPERWQSTINDEASWNTSLHLTEEEHSATQTTLDEYNKTLQQSRQQHNQLQLQLKQARKDHRSWSDCQNITRDILQYQPDLSLTSSNEYQQLRTLTHSEQREAVRQDAQLEKSLSDLRIRLRKLQISESVELQQLQRLAELTGGTVISDYFDNDDISLEEAAWLEAKFGPLRHALQVRDTTKAAALIREETDRPEHIWLLAGEPGSSFSEDDYLTANDNQIEDGNVLVNMSDTIARLSREPEFPTIGRLAREKEQQRLNQLGEDLLDQRQELAVQLQQLEKRQQKLDQLASLQHWLNQDEPPVEVIEEQLEELTLQQEAVIHKLQQTQLTLTSLNDSLKVLHKWQNAAYLLNDDPTQESVESIQTRLTAAEKANEWLNANQHALQVIEQSRIHIEQPPAEDFDQLRAQLKLLNDELSQLGQKQALLEDATGKMPDLRFKISLSRRDETESLQNTLKEEHQHKELQRQTLFSQVEQLKAQSTTQQVRIAEEGTRLKEKENSLYLIDQQIKEIPLPWKEDLEANCRQYLISVRVEKEDLNHQFTELSNELVKVTSEYNAIEKHLNNTLAEIAALTPKSSAAYDSHEAILEEAERSGLLGKLHSEHLQTLNADQLRTGLANARAQLEKALGSEPDSLLYQSISNVNISDLQALFRCCLDAQQYLSERMDKTMVQSDDPRQALDQLESHLTKLETLLQDAENRFLAESDHLGRNIQRRINMERKQVHQLNSALSAVYFGTIRSIKIELEVIESYQKVLDALQQQFYADMFQQPEMTVEQALEQLFKRETGGSIMGEKLLDYREYINLRVLIQRAGSTQYEAANPTNLSTGEAIGTGLAVLTIVLHSWEVATDKRHGNGHAASRLLFLDEAARLDARALETLEELCANQSLQLLVGAPDNVLPKNGVTYRMVRLMEPYEHVIFSAVRGKLPKVTTDAPNV
ncbi:hypothetical protein ACH42_16880 [Endozoicomonas sp. (ex Bugula neritina AB1)]|nr:hypothetical protein ACH42_16880 [Endozoicomonas sp. (ex Bugula neritina AB1)]